MKLPPTWSYTLWISTTLWSNQSEERSYISCSHVWKHSGFILMPAENSLQFNEREMTGLKCRRGNQPSAEHLRRTAAYLSSAWGLASSPLRSERGNAPARLQEITMLKCHSLTVLQTTVEYLQERQQSGSWAFMHVYLHQRRVEYAQMLWILIFYWFK